MPIESFLALGRSGKSAWWRYLLGSFLIILSLVLTQIALVLLLQISKGPSMLRHDYAYGVAPLLVIVALTISFSVWLFCIWLIFRLCHKRTLLSFITPAKQLNWRRIVWGLVTWTCLNICINLITWLAYPGSYEFNFRLSDFVHFFPLVLLLAVVQCFAEEVFFRGYLLQAVSSIVKNGLLLAMANGLLFVIPYLCNPQSARSPAVMAYMLTYVFTGFILALVTIRTNSLEAAIGMHIANNLFMALVVSNYLSPIKTSPIFTRTSCSPGFELPVFFLSAVIFYWLNVKLINRKTEATMTEPLSD